MFLEENKYLEYVRNNPEEYPGPNELFDAHFEFNSLFYSVYRRFIELLYPATNHFFRKTSKKIYLQCLDLRGIEITELSWDYLEELHGTLCLESGKIALNLNEVPTNWAKCLVVTGSVNIAYPRHGAVPDVEKLDFVKKNTRLFIVQGYAEQLEYLIHPRLEKVWIFDSLEFDHLLRFLNKLNVCQRLESIYFCNDKVQSAAAFKQLKQQLEQLAGHHPQAQITCNLGKKKEFQIHENVFCHCPEPGVFVKDYNFEDLRRY